MFQTYIDILLIVKNGFRRRICYAIHRYAKAKSKYMRDCDKNNESSSSRM